MKIERLFNHNVLLSRNENGDETVYMGKGLAFQKKVGDEIDPQKIEKEFILKDSIISSQFQQVLSNIPSEEFEVVKQIIELAEKELQIELLNNTYIALADHIHYAIQRYREKVILPNPLLFETKKFYPDEYRVAKKSLEIVQKELNVSFTDEEAGFIAFHLVNGQQKNVNMEVTMLSTTIVKDILNIISRFFGIILVQEDINFQRIVTHLQFFVKRYLSDEPSEDEDQFLYTVIQEKYSRAFNCVQAINDYLMKTQGKAIDNAEQVYLTIHIQRVVKEENTQ